MMRWTLSRSITARWRASAIPEDDRHGAIDGAEIDREHLVDDARQRVERRLDGIAAVDGHVPAQDLLEHFRVRHQSLTIGDRMLEDPRGIGFPGVRGADQVHRDIGADGETPPLPPAQTGNAWSWVQARVHPRLVLQQL
jgi:hypothetical protein